MHARAHHAPTLHASSLEAAPLLPLVADVSIGQLRELATWMALDGQRVSLSRLCVDRVYAVERLAEAHASDIEPLRALAVTLFAAYEPGRPGLAH